MPRGTEGLVFLPVIPDRVQGPANRGTVAMLPAPESIVNRDSPRFTAVLLCGF